MTPVTTDTRCIDAMLVIWNCRDADVMAKAVEEALDPDLEFCDPLHDIRGHQAFMDMVKAFWAKYPEARLRRSSGIDAHHDRARYAWAIDLPGGHCFEGFDAVTLDRTSGKVRRIDGFFGPLPPA